MARSRWLLVMSLLIAAISAYKQISSTEFVLEDGTLIKLPNPKYFQEAKDHGHYDARYFVGELEPEDQSKTIKILLQTYLSTMKEIGVQTWLMHGTLLGWWWGKKVMPWDVDADVQVSESDIYFLAAYHNMTTYYYKYGDMETGKTFLLDISGYYDYRGKTDFMNAIDGRWIDMETGLYIDITAARYDLENDAGEGVLMDKYGHMYRDTYLYPLRKTSFENVTAWIPYAYKDMLKSEYGEKALKATSYRGYDYDPKKKQWIKNIHMATSDQDYKDNVIEAWRERHRFKNSPFEGENETDGDDEDLIH